MCSILSFLGCRSPHHIKNDIYLYGTDEFENKIQTLNVSLENAAVMASEFYFKAMAPEKVEAIVILNIIQENFYIFTTVIHNPKQLEYNMTGIWVNGITGETKYVDTKKWTNVDLSRYPVSTFMKTIKNEH